MLTCIFHPIDSMRVVEEDEAEKLMASGFWFDCPGKAQSYRNELEEDMKKEKVEKAELKKKKPEKLKDKPEEQST